MFAIASIIWNYIERLPLHVYHCIYYQKASFTLQLPAKRQDIRLPIRGQSSPRLLPLFFARRPSYIGEKMR